MEMNFEKIDLSLVFGGTAEVVSVEKELPKEGDGADLVCCITIKL